jgi:hypothetical protein
VAFSVLKHGLSALVMLALVAPLALAVKPTREEYADRVEPICKVNTEANARILKGARAMVRAGRLKAASSRFNRAALAFAKAVKQLKAVPRPAEDRAQLAKWLGYLDAGRSYLAKIGKALAADEKPEAARESIRLSHNSELANFAVLGFGFVYCHIDPSKFS